MWAGAGGGREHLRARVYRRDYRRACGAAGRGPAVEEAAEEEHEKIRTREAIKFSEERSRGGGLRLDEGGGGQTQTVPHCVCVRVCPCVCVAGLDEAVEEAAEAAAELEDHVRRRRRHL